jgi:ABC-type Mn2+/Zn2+ transport system ATPase subunit
VGKEFVVKPKDAGLSFDANATVASATGRTFNPIVMVADLLGQRLGTLSGGQFQRILVAAALLQKPELLLLDEPSASVDRRGSDDLSEILEEIHRSTSLSILFVSHDLHFVSHLAKKVCCLNQTCCATGDPETVLTDHLLAQTYGSTTHTWRGFQPSTPLPR